MDLIISGVLFAIAGLFMMAFSGSLGTGYEDGER